MPTYKVAGTDILHNTKLYPDGSTIELTKSDADRLADYLEFIKQEPEVPAEEVKKEEVKKEEEKQEIKEEVKQEEVKPTKPARPPRPRPVKVAPIQPQKVPETIPLASTTTIQAETATPPVTTQENQPQAKTQVPPAAQKVIANVVEQVNKSIQGTTPQGGISYQITPPGNMRSA